MIEEQLPSHPVGGATTRAPVPEYPVTADELRALVARGRMLRARAVRALWLRLRRRFRTPRRPRTWRPGHPAAQHQVASGRHCEALPG